MFKEFYSLNVENLLKILISLRIRLASITSPNAVWIFLIATSDWVYESNAEYTTPYAPHPIIFVTVYRSSTVTKVPWISKLRFPAIVGCKFLASMI